MENIGDIAKLIEQKINKLEKLITSEENCDGCTFL